MKIEARNILRIEVGEITPTLQQKKYLNDSHIRAAGLLERSSLSKSQAVKMF